MCVPAASTRGGCEEGALRDRNALGSTPTYARVEAWIRLLFHGDHRETAKRWRQKQKRHLQRAKQPPKKPPLSIDRNDMLQKFPCQAPTVGRSCHHPPQLELKYGTYVCTRRVPGSLPSNAVSRTGHSCSMKSRCKSSSVMGVKGSMLMQWTYSTLSPNLFERRSDTR